jgi:hypothetical protein
MDIFENVEFNKIDGTTLRGKLFPAKERGPGVVMIPGVGKFVFLSKFRSCDAIVQ